MSDLRYTLNFVRVRYAYGAIYPLRGCERAARTGARGFIFAHFQPRSPQANISLTSKLVYIVALQRKAISRVEGAYRVSEANQKEIKVGAMDEDTYKTLVNKCGAIRRKLISSITTAKSND